MMDIELVYQSMKRLNENSDWKILKKHFEDIINIHKETAILQLADKNNTTDAQRQCWVIRGIEEVLDEPQRLIKVKDNMPGVIVKKAANNLKEFLKGL